MTDPILSAKNIAFGYGKESLFERFSCEIGRGETVAIVGANGAGKTTLLKCLIGALNVRTGSVLLFGSPIRSADRKTVYETIAYVPQKTGIPLSYTVTESVLLGLTGRLSLFGQPGRREAEEAGAILESLDLEKLKDKQMNELSGGELQMVRIAGALVKKPKLLVLDEPETGLDYRNQLRVLETIRTLKRDNVSCIFNTHYPEHALQYADRVVLFLKDEKTPLFGTTESLMTEENIKNALGVDVRITGVDVDSNHIKTIIPIHISKEEMEK